MAPGTRGKKAKAAKAGRTVAQAKAAAVTKAAREKAREASAAKQRRREASAAKQRSARQNKKLATLRNARFPKVPGVQSGNEDEGSGDEDQEDVTMVHAKSKEQMEVEMREMKEKISRYEGRVPAAITAEEAEVTTAITISTGGVKNVIAKPAVPIIERPSPVSARKPGKQKLSVAHQKATLDGREVRADILEKMNSYVGKQIFKVAKFAMERTTERKICLNAVKLKKVLLPEGVEPEVFADHCSFMVRRRMSKMRCNIHSSCKFKFDCK